MHRLKTFLDNNVDLPEDIALTDDPKSHTIERILSHEGNRNKPNTLKFKVKWADQTEQESSLESYNNIKNNLALHEYLTTLGEAWPALIPISFTDPGEHYTKLHPNIKKAAKRKLETKTAIPARILLNV